MRLHVAQDINRQTHLAVNPMAMTNAEVEALVPSSLLQKISLLASDEQVAEYFNSEATFVDKEAEELPENHATASVARPIRPTRQRKPTFHHVRPNALGTNAPINTTALQPLPSHVIIAQPPPVPLAITGKRTREGTADDNSRRKRRRGLTRPEPTTSDPGSSTEEDSSESEDSAE